MIKPVAVFLVVAFLLLPVGIYPSHAYPAVEGAPVNNHAIITGVPAQGFVMSDSEMAQVEGAWWFLPWIATWVARQFTWNAIRDRAVRIVINRWLMGPAY